jgi:four helix bundle protein
MKLGELEVYKLAREISREVWLIYERLDWRDKKIMGDQWIRSVDSISANVAEGFGRFHYLDKNKFNYNARGSLFEVLDWTDKLHEREKRIFVIDF